MRTTWFALSLCMSVASGTAARVAQADPTAASVWKHDFAEAEAEAKRLNRPLVVHFGAVWCPPCKKMEREALHSAQALKLLDEGFVAVKVDVDKNKSITKKFAVSNMPTDLILSPEGKELIRSEGYDAGGQKQYLANLAKINSQYIGKVKRPERSDIIAEGNSKGSAPRVSQTPGKKDRALASAAPSTKDKLVPPANKIDPPAGSQANEPLSPDEPRDVPPAIEPDDVLVAMDGYCPVTLRTTRSWKSGDKEISHEYEGQLYYFVSAERRNEFKAHPSRYAPRLLGCDPVTLADNDVAVRGSTQFGAFYDGALFLFESNDSRAKFRKSPTRYSQLKHVLKPEDVKNVASNVDP